jgi:hypothetical protein
VFKFRVAISVSGDPVLGKIVTGHVTKKLKNIDDVELVTYEQAQWILDILALNLATESGYKTGVAISLVVAEKFDNRLLIDDLPDMHKDFADDITANLHYYPEHRLWAGEPNKVKQLCSTLVVYFNSEYIERIKKEISQY